jgi:hypothetical protein
MTWHAQDGDLVLQGDEANLFRDAILYFCDVISAADDDADSVYGGASVFDQMTRTQQLASIELVTKYLFHETGDCLELSAWSEATLASILSQIRTLLHLEADEGDKDEIRCVISRLTECEVSKDDWNDWSEWDIIVDAYEDRFLWDSDFEDTKITDLPPDHADSVRQMMGIADEYYSSVPPDLDDDRDITDAVKRIWMCIDGTKTIKMTVTLTTEVPASLEIKNDEEGYQTIRGCFPSMIIMQDDGEGGGSQVDDELDHFFMNGCVMDHSIEVVGLTNEET